jgi:hypothetical protein
MLRNGQGFAIRPRSKLGFDHTIKELGGTAQTLPETLDLKNFNAKTPCACRGAKFRFAGHQCRALSPFLPLESYLLLEFSGYRGNIERPIRLHERRNNTKRKVANKNSLNAIE